MIKNTNVLENEQKVQKIIFIIIISFVLNNLKIKLARSGSIQMNPNLIFDTDESEPMRLRIQIETLDWPDWCGLIFNWFAKNELKVTVTVVAINHWNYSDVHRL